MKRIFLIACLAVWILSSPRTLAQQSTAPLPKVLNTLNGGDIPVAWINTKYRMVYLNYGHGDRIYSTQTLPTMIDNSVSFLLKSSK